MTKTQIKNSMKFSGIEGEVTGRGSNWTVELPDEETKDRFCSQICQAGGYRTGYGSWILSADHKDMGDYNDSSSRWHY